MVAERYRPAPAPKLYAGGKDLFAAMKMGVWTMQQSGFISEHDAVIGEKLAYIISGGRLSTPQWVSEQYFFDLEREIFCELAATEKSQQRIWHMLQTGKPLRN
jgi:3-hydroxyacyl-CoA dehydrogenase